LLAIAGGHSLIDANTAFDLIDGIAIGFGLYVAYLAVRATVTARRLSQELRALDR
jgi:hypothetical protein